MIVIHRPCCYQEIHFAKIPIAHTSTFASTDVIRSEGIHKAGLFSGISPVRTFSREQKAYKITITKIRNGEKTALRIPVYCVAVLFLFSDEKWKSRVLFLHWWSIYSSQIKLTRFTGEMAITNNSRPKWMSDAEAIEDFFVRKSTSQLPDIKEIVVRTKTWNKFSLFHLACLCNGTDVCAKLSF